MDRSLYLAVDGASRALQTQARISHNLSNASTVGFKALLSATEAAPVVGPGLPSRVGARAVDAGFDARSGALMHTARDLDVALADGHWLAVQAPDGAEAFTRAGDLRLTPLGQLTTGAGHPVMGEGGPIAVPPSSKLTIATDGTVSLVPAGEGAQTQVEIGRLRVVAASPDQLSRREDGLFAAGVELEPAAGAVLSPGALEASNVNLADTMVAMIDAQRQFEMQIRAMRTVEENAENAASLLRLGS